jgi:DNA polymerase
MRGPRRRKILVWADWSAIEARVLPWLAGSQSAERCKLQLFRDGKDVYLYTAASIFNTSHDKVDKAQRQIGKVGDLSLGFGGGVGAFKGMARNYTNPVTQLPMTFTDDEALRIVRGWRSANPWAPRFWDELKGAALNALRSPGQSFKAGRVEYAFEARLLGGSLLVFLPCGRPLLYPRCALRTVENPKTKEKTDALTYWHGEGWRKAWHGLLAENITQGFAASILRSCLTENFVAEHAVAHTHDEIVIEVYEDEAEQAGVHLREIMVRERKWTTGLPLKAEVKKGWYYTKSEVEA